MTKIMDAFLQDHNILDRMLQEFLQAQQSAQSNTMELFNDLRNAINAHMSEEEETYKIFKNRSQELDEVIRSVRAQHEKIKRTLIDMCDEEEDCDHVAKELVNFMNLHEKFEEQYLYPKMDELLTDEEKERIKYSLQSRVKKTA